ncbi:putative glycolipid-binding domain-containing protein [Burkholderia sp. 22PA0099]|uniref:putative glycolipid-binding domain-containing protein n=1 Tax=Burkholderia sp. 22PA0099 TaxID=3237372 RepID=UPI0039C1318B
MRDVRWASLDSDGIEHLTLVRDGGGYLAESVIVGRHDDGRRYGLAYRVACDAHWRTTRATLTVMGGATLTLERDRGGHWCEVLDIGERSALPALEGCVDLDIAATPFTNTLPIRRLGLKRDERRTIDVAYVTIPELSVARATQTYVCIEPGRRYRYEGIDGRFKAGLSVDDDGLVVEYDTLFRRLPAV